MPPAQHSSRRQKIEPLNYAEAALAPALKGMTSFLDISPENVKNNSFESFGPSRSVHLPAPEHLSAPGDETYPDPAPTPKNKIGPKPVTPITHNRKTVSRQPTEQTPRPVLAPRNLSYPGDETSPEHERTPAFDAHASEAVTPGRGRSKVRRCVLAQDGHSLGEEAIYQVMWRGGQPENGDVNGARVIRIGAADLGYKVNMAKKNVRQNISRLFEKLAVEILEDFETMSSQARLYRVFSYKQILERRRAVGLEYVLRNKGVVFCTANGEQLVSSPAYVSSPGYETSIRPAPPKKRRSAPLEEVHLFAQPQTPSRTPEGSASEDEEIVVVSQALNRYWPVDHAAAVQLVKACRKVRPDARISEITFFVREKLELSRQSRTITNPVGLILATVPQSFVGPTFVSFRERMERQAQVAAEEADRQRSEAEAVRKWFDEAAQRYEAIASDPDRPQQERDQAEKWLRQNRM